MHAWALALGEGCKIVRLYAGTGQDGTGVSAGLPGVDVISRGSLRDNGISMSHSSLRDNGVDVEMGLYIQAIARLVVYRPRILNDEREAKRGDR